MSTGLLALLDDVAALVKVSAATLDDIPAQVAKTGAKVSGIVIDDAAVTPKYVVGLDPKRELSIIYHIAKKSLVNKLVFLGPLAMLLGFFIPWIIQPILMVGGCYLCFEGYEKVHSIFAKKLPTKKQKKLPEITPEKLEKIRINSAVRTDFILSAEIMAITYSTIADKDILTQIIVMAAVAVGITIAVYGFVGVIVKADDVGLHFACGNYHKSIQKFGRGLVKFMPNFLQILAYIGTAAMLWVGAEIILHGIPNAYEFISNNFKKLALDGAFLWALKALFSALCGLTWGGVITSFISLKSYFKKA